jgi:6-phosphogluconolactonase
MNSSKASLYVVPTKDHIPYSLHSSLMEVCEKAIKARGVFTIALSGGSLPSFLSNLNESFASCSLDPKYDCWHVLLADERCVPSEHPENNLNAIRTNFLSKVSIPLNQIYGIDESKLSDSTEEIARDYETSVRSVLKHSGGYLDLALLGFGPDGTLIFQY